MTFATSLPYIRTRKNTRTMRSLLTSVRPQRFAWPRLRETELLAQEHLRWQARRSARRPVR